MARRVKGEEAWRYDTICALCRSVIGPEDTAYIIGEHVFHEKCLNWLLQQPREKFEEILSRLPLDTHEELRKLYEEKHKLIEAIEERHKPIEAMEEGGEQKPSTGERYVEFEWPLDRGLDELERELRRYGVDWVSVKTRPIEEPVIRVEIDVEDREAELTIPRFLMENQPFFDLISMWIARYREKYGGIERMEREMEEYFRQVVERLRKREGGERKREHGSSSEDPPERREASREARRALWRLAWRIVDEALKAAGARRAGELRVDGIASEKWSPFSKTLVETINKYVSGAGVRLEARRDEQGNIREADIYLGGEYWGTWRFYEPRAGSTRNWAHRVYNLLRAAYEAGYEVLAPVGGGGGRSG